MKTGMEQADRKVFSCYGTPGAQAPLVFAVPHAGRAYHAELLALARVPPATLARLEDRLADHLVDDLIAAGHCVLVAHSPRAMIDLNRSEQDIDAGVITDLPPDIRPGLSAKARGGLGLVPDRLAHAGALWKRPLRYAELRARIEAVHRPYHAALAAALALTCRRHGTAMLIDVHSMPPLRSAITRSGGPPQVVIGDRFGRSASQHLTDLCADIVRGFGIAVVINTPYAGNHILGLHGRPQAGIHAIQIEIDRTLYLNRDMMTLAPEPMLARVRSLLAALAQHLGNELTNSGTPMAAE